MIWKERNHRSFENEEHFAHRLKHSLLCNLWTWSKLFLVSSLPFIVEFVDWLGLF